MMLAYHDTEWGVPEHDDARLFEFLVLSGFQAGLSWSTILRKRAAFQVAFKQFDPAVVARFSSRDRERLMRDPGIIRNGQKIDAAIKNAKAVCAVQGAFGSFDQYIWQFTKGRTIRGRWNDFSEVPAATAESEAMSADMKRRGFGFAGPTICYAFMQTIGMVNDHLTWCFRYRQLRQLRG